MRASSHKDFLMNYSYIIFSRIHHLFFACLLLISMLWHRQAIFESKGDKLSSSVECRIRTQGLRQLFASRLNACWQTDWAIEDQAKTWIRQPVLMISKHSAHSTSLPVGFRTWLWRYTCLLLLISMLWHRQVIFESKGDKLFSSAECRIRTQGLNYIIFSRIHHLFFVYMSPHWKLTLLNHFGSFWPGGLLKCYNFKIGCHVALKFHTIGTNDEKCNIPHFNISTKKGEHVTWPEICNPPLLRFGSF